MVKTVDSNKIEKVKKALVDIVVIEGSNNASISKVAHRAGVSSGYLYRHYRSKNSFIASLYDEKFKEFHQILLQVIDQSKTLKETLLRYYTTIIHRAKVDENEILFFLKIMTDYSVKLSSDNQEQMIETIHLIREKFNREISHELTEEQVFTQVMGTILLFVNLRKRALFSNASIQDSEIQAMTQMTLNALK